MHLESQRQQFLAKISNLSSLVQLTNVLPDVFFFIKDRAGRFQALNRCGWDYCGVSSESEDIGKTDFDFFPKFRAQMYSEDDQHVMASGQRLANRIEPAPESEGSPYLVMTTKIPLTDSSGAVIGVAGISRRLDRLHGEPEALGKLAAAVRYIHKHSTQSIRSEDLAKQSGMSTRQLERSFRSLLCTTPRKYLLHVRVERASRLLLESDDTVAAVALECGFYDHAHFIKIFQDAMGCTPSCYRLERRHGLHTD